MAKTTPHGRGVLMPIGGHEDKTGDRAILARFVELAGGDAARIAIIPTASTDRETGERYEPIFRDLGAAEATVLDFPDRAAANGDDEALAYLAGATGVFISGGDQTRLVEILAGTRAAECVRHRHLSGVAVAGTSAGASILSSHMMEGGGNEDTPRKGMASMIAGFGLAPDLIIDQHFSQRGRIGRLLTLFASSPGLIALGIDEDTAAVIAPDDTLEVIGTNSVTLVEGRAVRSNYFDAEGGDVLTISGAVLHILGPGSRFDLDRRALIARPHDDPA